MPSSITLPASADSLGPLAAWLQDHMALLPVDETWCFALDLAVCEAAANVIHHALAAEPGRTFTVNFHREEQGVRVALMDAGLAFPAASLYKAQRKIGSDEELDLESGRGLMLILQSVDRFSVAREGDRNITTLVKKYQSA
ncbi:ATP-binding protein [Kosakonia sp.]|uniref:ATP-binding protein n=1 Tax=Kosakonia sp. TaxID=1916651 RepID=UPI00289E0DDB|nr:ATP-binding protein [Kosakonia sp.]